MATGTSENTETIRGWRAAYRRQHPALRVAGALGWALILYTALMGILAGLFTTPGHAVTGPVWLLTRPMEFYLDLRDMAGRAIDGVLVAFGMVGAWTLIGPALPRRGKKPAAALEKIEPRKPVVLQDADPGLDLGEDRYDAFRQAAPKEESADKVSDFVQRLITRFIDIQTLQPVGVLRSVLVLLDSDIESYRHLLRTKECLVSLKKLKTMPPEVFDNDDCLAILEEDPYAEIFRELKTPLYDLVPMLIQRIEGELSDTSIMAGVGPADRSVLSGVSWSDRHMVTRFEHIHTLQPVGILRSLLVLLASPVDRYRHLLGSPEALRSIETLKSLPPDIFENEHCLEILGKEKYAALLRQTGVPVSELVPTLIRRVEGRERPPAMAGGEPGIDSSFSPGISWYAQHMVTRFVDIRTLQPVGILRSVLVLLHSKIESYRDLLKTPECRASMERLKSLPANVFDNEHCREILQKEKYALIYKDLNIPLNELVPRLIARVEGGDVSTSKPLRTGNPWE